MREIVAAKIGIEITNNIVDIVSAARNNTLTDIYDRRHMQLMASFDLGRHWNVLANGKTLFLIDDNGTPHWPKEEAA